MAEHHSASGEKLMEPDPRTITPSRVLISKDTLKKLIPRRFIPEVEPQSDNKGSVSVRVLPKRSNLDNELLIGSPEIIPQRPVSRNPNQEGSLNDSKPEGPFRIVMKKDNETIEPTPSTSSNKLRPRRQKSATDLLIKESEPPIFKQVPRNISTAGESFNFSRESGPRPVPEQRSMQMEEGYLIGSAELFPTPQDKVSIPDVVQIYHRQGQDNAPLLIEQESIPMTRSQIPDMVPLYGGVEETKSIPPTEPLFIAQPNRRPNPDMDYVPINRASRKPVPDMEPLNFTSQARKSMPDMEPLTFGNTRKPIPDIEPLFSTQEVRPGAPMMEAFLGGLIPNLKKRKRKNSEGSLIQQDSVPLNLADRRGTRLQDQVSILEMPGGPQVIELNEEGFETTTNLYSTQISIRPSQDSLSIKKDETSLANQPDAYEFIASKPQQRLQSMPGRTQMKPMPSHKVTISQPRAFRAAKPIDRGGFLTMGDIVSMNVISYIVPTIGHHQPFEYHGVISADGIADLTCEVLPINKLTENKTVVLFRQCLFRIEPSRQYGFSNRLASYRTKDFPNIEILEKLQEQVKEESQGNDAELEISLGRHITFGERIQLRHIHSDAYLTVSLNIAKENGCLQIELDKVGSEASWFEIMPSNKLRQEGEPVRYSDMFTLSTTVEKSKYYLHMQVTSLTKRTMNSEVNASDASTAWKAEKYISYADLKKNPNFVATGDSFRIMHQQYDGYLSVNPRDIDKILPKDITIVPEEEARKLVKEAMCLIADNEYDANTANVVESEIFVEYTKSSLNMWELERQNFFIGGTAQFNEIYRIKHIGSGLYMGVDDEGKLKLMSNGNSNKAHFRFIDDAMEFQTLTFNKLIKIESVEHGKNIQVEEAKVDIKSFFQGVEIKTQERAPLTLSKNPKERVRTAFMLVDEVEANSIHVYQISLIIPKFLEFFRYLQCWGLLVLGKERYSEELSMAKGKELELEEAIDKACQILSNIRERIIRHQDTDIRAIRARQDAVRESGLLELMLRIAQKAEFRMKRVVNQNQNMSSSMLEEEGPQSSGTIAKPYLTKLVKDIYKTVRICINNNVQSCQSLYKYDSFLSSQLSFYKSEIGMILREAFSHSADILSSFKKSDFQSWIQQVRPLTEENIDEQTLIFKILTSMCVHKGKGVLRYQLLIEHELLGKESFIKVFKFSIHRSRPCIEIQRSQIKAISGFIEENPTFMSLLEDLEEESVTVIFLAKLATQDKYIGYFKALLGLLANTCINNYEQGISSVIKIFKLTFDFVFNCIKKNDVPIDLRTQFLKLAQVLFVERVQAQQPLSESTNWCFYWNSHAGLLENEPSDSLASAIQVKEKTFPVASLVHWIESCWRNIEAPYSKVVGEQNDSRAKKTAIKSYLNFATQLLQLSNSLLDYNYVNYEFMLLVYTPAMLLLRSYKHIDSHRRRATSHWCSELKIKASKPELETKLENLMMNTLKLLETASHMKINRQINDLLERFGSGDTLEVPDDEIDKLSYTLYEASDFNSARVHVERKRAAINITGKNIMRFAGRDVAPDMPLHEITSPEEDLYMDMFLLDLVFETSGKSLKQSALNLIIKNFNQRTELKEQLDNVLLMDDEECRACYRKFRRLQASMLHRLRNLRYLSDSHEGENLGKDIPFGFTNWRLDLISMQELLLKSSVQPTLAERQQIARNLGLHEIILEFLNFNYCWIKDAENGRKGIHDDALAVYSEALESLYKFCFKNEVNEQILFDNIACIIRFFGNKVGSTRLLSLILSSQRKTENSEKIIQYVFTTVTSEGDPRKRPLDLKILRMLVRSEDGAVHTLSQTNIFKQLMQNRMLVGCYTRDDNAIDFTVYHQENSSEINFHYCFILLLANCAIQNSFVTQQLRRLLPISRLISELESESAIPLNVKKAYLHFLFYVYYLNNKDLEKEIDLKKIYEILYSIIIPDLERFVIELDPWIVCCQKGLCELVPCTKAETEQYNAIRSMLNVPNQANMQLSGMLSLKKPSLVQQTSQRKKALKNELTKEQQQALYYWRYVTNRKPWIAELSTGLFTFLFELFAELEAEQIEDIGDYLAYAFDKLKLILQQMHDEFIDRAKKHPELDFSIMIDQINELLAKYPSYIPEEEKVPAEFTGRDSYNAVLKGCLDVIQDRKVTPLDFFKYYLQDPKTVINRIDLTSKLKNILENRVSRTHIDEMLTYIELSQDNFTLDQFAKDVRKYFRKVPLYVRKEMNPPPQPPGLKTNEMFHEFMNVKLSSLFNNKNAQELRLLMAKVKKNVIDDALNRGEQMQLQTFTENMKSTFNKRNHKIYLLMMFETLIRLESNEMVRQVYERTRRAGKDLDELDFNDHDKDRLNQIQSIFSRSGVGIMAISLITPESDLDLVDKAVDLLVALLKHNRGEVKQKIYEFLFMSPLTFEIFSYIKVMIRESYERVSRASSINERSDMLIGHSFRAVSTSIPANSGVNKPRLLKKVLKMLKLCCDNGYTPFQNFLRDQTRNLLDMRVSVDLVSEITQYLINMHHIPEVTYGSWSEASSITRGCLKTLIDLCSGPCLENQELIGVRSRVYDFVNWFIHSTHDIADKSFVFKGLETPYLKVFKQLIIFLRSLIEGGGSIHVAQCMKNSLDFSALTLHATLIYRDLIYGREELVHQQNKGESIMILRCLELRGDHVTSDEQKRIETGFDIQILILTLADIFPEENKLRLEYRSATAENFLRTEELTEAAIRSRSLRSEIKVRVEQYMTKVKKLLINKTEIDEEFGMIQAADTYYSMNIGRVEVLHKQELVKLLFYMPPLTKYFTDKSRKDLISKVNRNSQQEKIEDFYNRSKGIEVEMKHQQKLARWPCIDSFCSHWNRMAQLAFVLLIFLNLVLFFSVEHVDGRTGDWRFSTTGTLNAEALVRFLSISQVVLSFLVLVCYLVEYYPLIIVKGRNGGCTEALLAYEKDKFNRIKGTLLMKELVWITKKSFENRVSSSFMALRALFKDRNFLYALCYFIMSFIGNIFILLYCLLLLDVIRRSGDLVNVLKAITLNWKQLLLTLVLGCIVIYLFSIVAFLELHDYYVTDGTAEMNTYCDSLLSCFASTTCYGIRAGGGIGDWLAQAEWGDSKYWLRYTFDMAYFILVCVILLNVIFGIIIDTFADLRDKRNEILKDIKETCFICGRSRFEFEVKHLSWKNHIYLEHNLYSYLAFIIYIRNKKTEDCTGAEKHVQERILLNDVSFIPRTSLSIEAMEEAGEADETLKARNTMKHLRKAKAQLDKLFVLSDSIHKSDNK
mmetsp:Transcript_1137/g.2746  ORF Transcript_1137/g.2746 Transcript_1137/m.2746 type:complete len:3258 (-) Transcript_1137:2504-12277(-)